MSKSIFMLYACLTYLSALKKEPVRSTEMSAINNYIKLNYYLFTRELKSPEANYKLSKSKKMKQQNTKTK